MLKGSARNQHDVLPPPLRRTMPAATASTSMMTVPKLSMMSIRELLVCRMLPFPLSYLNRRREKRPKSNAGKPGKAGNAGKAEKAGGAGPSGKRKGRAGGIIPPAPPCFRLPASSCGGTSGRHQKPVFACGKGGARRGFVSALLRRHRQCRRARLRPPAVADSGTAQPSRRVKGKDIRMSAPCIKKNSGLSLRLRQGRAWSGTFFPCPLCAFPEGGVFVLKVCRARFLCRGCDALGRDHAVGRREPDDT